MWSLHAVVTCGARISTLAVTLFLIQENWSLGGAAITFIGVGILDRGAELPPEVPAFAERGDPGNRPQPRASPPPSRAHPPHFRRGRKDLRKRCEPTRRYLACHADAQRT